MMTHPKNALFQKPREIKLNESYPDSAMMYKHLASLLYGVRSRLDTRQEALLTLRQVNHRQLITTVQKRSLIKNAKIQVSENLNDEDLSSIFCISIEQDTTTQKKNSSLKQGGSTASIKTMPKSTQKPSIKDYFRSTSI